MRLLIDTHALLWFRAASANLTPAAREAIEDPANDLLLSIASIWELAIKISLGRLSVGMPLQRYVEERISDSGIELLSIAPRYVYLLTDMPMHHRDPFDRLIAAQCTVEQLPLISADPVFDAYGVSRVW